MKAKETFRGDTVIYNGFEAIVIEPMINNVKISYNVEGQPRQITVTYNLIDKLES